MPSSEITAGQVLRKPPKITALLPMWRPSYQERCCRFSFVVLAALLKGVLLYVSHYTQDTSLKKKKGLVADNNKKKQLVIPKTAEVVPFSVDSAGVRAQTGVVRLF